MGVFFEKCLCKKRIRPATTRYEKSRRKKAKGAAKWKVQQERWTQEAKQREAARAEYQRKEAIQAVVNQVHAWATAVPAPRDLRRLAEYITLEFQGCGTDASPLCVELRWVANKLEYLRRQKA